MTAIPEWVDISAGHAVPSGVERHALIGLRETLGTVYQDADFPAQYAEARRRNPGIVTLGYTFLTGPLRAATVPEQVRYWASRHRCDLGALDWERDSYTHAGQKFDKGIQPFASVLDGLTEARERGINAGVYMSRYLASPTVVEQLLARPVPFLWIAAYGGLTIPAWIVNACRDAGALLFHQYAGDTIDRNRVLVGTLEQLHALAGHPAPPVPGPAPKPPEDAMHLPEKGNLFPITARRVLDIPAGTVLWSLDGTKYTTTSKPVTLGLLFATGTTFVVADGDVPVYLPREGLTPRTADLNAGK